jgi:hypothetical protein
LFQRSFSVELLHDERLAPTIDEMVVVARKNEPPETVRPVVEALVSVV